MADRVLNKDLKLITDRHDRSIEGHEGRIKKLEKVQDDHLQRHEDVYDPMAKKHEKLLLGEDGSDGMVRTINNIQNTLDHINQKLTEKDDNNKWLTRAIISTLITSIITAIMTLIAK